MSLVMSPVIVVTRSHETPSSGLPDILTAAHLQPLQGPRSSLHVTLRGEL